MRGLSPAALAMVPGACDTQGQVAAHVKLTRLRGGSVNRLWRVDTAQGRFVVRVDGPAWRRPGVDRAREQLVHTAAAACDIAPRLVRISAQRDVWVMEYIAGRRWQQRDYRQLAQLRRLLRQLAAVHRLQLPAQSAARFDPLRLAGDYARQAQSGHGAAPGEAHTFGAGQIAAALDAVAAAAEAIERAAQPLVIVHGDPTARNVLDDGQLRLIDWEYAQCADPVFDLAVLLTYHPAARRLLPKLLAEAALDGDRLDERLAAAEVIHRQLGVLWYAARGAPPPPVLAPAAPPLASAALSRQTSAPELEVTAEDAQCRC